MKTTDPRVKAIRTDSKVGAGSCSTIDECWTDEELAAELDADEVTSPTAAIKWARTLEGLHIENALNCRYGTDDDPELARYEEWNQ